MGIDKLFASFVIVITAFISSHLNNFLHVTKPVTNIKQDVLSMDEQPEEKMATPSGKSSTSSNAVNTHNGNSSVEVNIKNGVSTVSVNGQIVKGNSGNNPSLDSLKYPGVNTTSSSANSLTLESSDSTDTITNWYKSKINSLGMNTKSFVTTKSNDKVLNKLVGANGSQEVSVEISQENSGGKVRIKVQI